jgi:ribosomal protein L2
MAVVKVKPTSAGRRAVVKVVHKHLHKGAPEAPGCTHKGAPDMLNNFFKKNLFSP